MAYSQKLDNNEFFHVYLSLNKSLLKFNNKLSIYMKPERNSIKRNVDKYFVAFLKKNDTNDKISIVYKNKVKGDVQVIHHNCH